MSREHFYLMIVRLALVQVQSVLSVLHCSSFTYGVRGIYVIVHNGGHPSWTFMFTHKKENLVISDKWTTVKNIPWLCSCVVNNRQLLCLNLCWDNQLSN